MNRFIHTLILVVVGLALVVGCRPQEFEAKPDPELGQEVLVSLSVRIASVTAPAPDPVAKGAGDDAWRVTYDAPQPTPEGKADAKTALYNLWLFQFNADGSLNGAPRQLSDGVTPVYDNTILEVPMVVSTNQTVYLLVLGPKLGQDLSPIRSLAELEATEFSYTESKEGLVVSKITSDAEIPFGGKTAGVTVISLPEDKEHGLIEFDTPTGFDGGIPIRRLMSKVTLSYLFNVDEYRLESIRFKNANTLLRLANPEKNSPDNDSYAELAMEDGPVDKYGYQTAYCYVAQNKYGTVATIATETDRYSKIGDTGRVGAAPEYGSNIEVWAENKLNPLYYAIYQIYVGNNNTSNFDVEQNHDYALRTYINVDPVASKTDGRIREYAFKLGVDYAPYRIVAEVQGSQLGKGANVNYHGIDAHFDQRRLAVYAKGELVRIELFEDEGCTKPLNPATSWVKLSSEPNYTLAYRSSAGLVTQITTEVLVPSRLNFHLYYDEYIDNDPTNLVALPARSAYIRISSNYLGTGTVHLTNIYETRQEAARYMGRLGGEIDAATGQYTQGLCIDYLDEEKRMYNNDEVSQSATRGIVYGYKDIATSVSGYDTHNTENGRQATRNLAENPQSLDVANLVTEYILNNPRRKANGVIDLYQYNYYNTFCARFCYDRNRDENGNGVLDSDELKWYLPASSQIIGYTLWAATSSGNVLFGYDASSTTEEQSFLNNGDFFKLTSSSYTFSWSNDKKSRITHRCVREVPAKSYPFP